MWKNLFTLEPIDVVLPRAYIQLLDPLRAVCPEARDATFKAWEEGRPIGPALADAIRAWGEQIRAEGKKTAATLYARFLAQEKQLTEQGKEIETSRKQMDELKKQIQKLEESNTEKTETIQSQNNLLVKQHEQFIRLLGSPKVDNAIK